jgi:hypothetical protein
MKRIRLVLATASAVLLSWSALRTTATEEAHPATRTRAEFAAAMAKVKKGMPEKEVLALLGKPDDIRTQYDHDAAIGSAPQGGVEQEC